MLQKLRKYIPAAASSIAIGTLYLCGSAHIHIVHFIWMILILLGIAAIMVISIVNARR